MADLSVAGRIYQDGGLDAGVLHIDSKTGRIEKITKSGKAGKGEHLDFGKAAILPGAIDMHTHMRDPGMEAKEDWQSGTVSAAFGGVTGVVDMPNTIPPTTTVHALDDKLERAQAKAVVDFGAYAGGTWFTEELPAMLERAMGVKVFLGATTGDLLLEDPEAFRKILTIAGEAGKPVVLHAESQHVLERNRRTEGGLPDHDAARPPVAEVEAIYEVMKTLPGLKQKPKIHICHVASLEALQAATTAGFSIGVCPHHLLLHTAHTFGMESLGKMNPPLRSEAAMGRLYGALADGKIPIVESDHAPHTRSEKEGPFHKAPAGVPGVETMLPLLLEEAMAGRIPLQTAVDTVTVGPAQLLGLDRGVLAPGKRADFTVVELDTATPIAGDALHSRCGWTPYEGMPARMPSHTYLAGQAVVTEGELVAKPGSAAPLA